MLTREEDEWGDGANQLMKDLVLVGKKTPPSVGPLSPTEKVSNAVSFLFLFNYESERPRFH